MYLYFNKLANFESKTVYFKQFGAIYFFVSMSYNIFNEEKWR